MQNMKEKNVYPWSFQVALFEYLKPEQQEAVRPILRVLKKPAQVKLCCALLDYLERGEVNPPANVTLWASFLYLTKTGLIRDNGSDPSGIRPSQCRSGGCVPLSHDTGAYSGGWRRSVGDPSGAVPAEGSGNQ